MLCVFASENLFLNRNSILSLFPPGMKNLSKQSYARLWMPCAIGSSPWLMPAPGAAHWS